MPYLKSFADIASAIGMTSGGSSPAASDQRFISMMDDVHSRIEVALNIPSLVYSGYVDSFDVLRDSRNSVTFRLHAAFIEEASVVVTTPSGLPASSEDYSLDREYGTLRIDYPVAGRYSVQYNAGFKSDEDGVYIDAPTWLRALTVAATAEWHRAVPSSAKMQGNVNPVEAMRPVYRYLSTAVYGRYQRPRTCVTYHATSRHSAAFEVVTP